MIIKKYKKSFFKALSICLTIWSNYIKIQKMNKGVHQCIDYVSLCADEHLFL